MKIQVDEDQKNKKIKRKDNISRNQQNNNIKLCKISIIYILKEIRISFRNK